MGYRSNSRAELRAEASIQQRRLQPKARDILISWARAREYRDGEAGYLQLARSASDPDVRDRFIAIAQHYRSLAKIEQSIADQRLNKKRRQSHLSGQHEPLCPESCQEEAS
jgi:hypothetical protein